MTILKICDESKEACGDIVYELDIQFEATDIVDSGFLLKTSSNGLIDVFPCMVLYTHSYWNGSMDYVSLLQWTHW